MAIIDPRVNQSSIVAGMQAKYASRKGTAPNIVAKADGKYTIFTWNKLCINHVHMPKKEASLKVAANTSITASCNATANLNKINRMSRTLSS